MEEEEKHEISILVECVLYEKLKSIVDEENMTNKDKRKSIKKFIEDFVQECIGLFEGISEDEIKKYAIRQLRRVNKNMNLPER